MKVSGFRDNPNSQPLAVSIQNQTLVRNSGVPYGQRGAPGIAAGRPCSARLCAGGRSRAWRGDRVFSHCPTGVVPGFARLPRARQPWRAFVLRKFRGKTGSKGFPVASISPGTVKAIRLLTEGL
jgi:hypothetical protein